MPDGADRGVITKITAGFWRDRLDLHSHQALEHQYHQLEITGCLDNFAIAAGVKDGFREGFFFADSDAYKWLEAASLALADSPNAVLEQKMSAFISLLEKAQETDGYLYTYNQIHFPGSRWQNLQVEHELYCLGHLIEAGVSHARSTGSDRLLKLAIKSADLIVNTFLDANPDQTDGHEEIEIALLRLHQCTGNTTYLEMADRFLQRRGRVNRYGLTMAIQLIRTALRMKKVGNDRKDYYTSHPGKDRIRLPARNAYHLPKWTGLRLADSLLSGRFTQNNLPAENQADAVGHAVRYVYLQTARTMLAGNQKDSTVLPSLAKQWKSMVERRMYVSGGLGSLPLIEGFGRDYELPGLGAYAETCAALGSIFWAREMGEQIGDPCYSDLLEWQLYNAAGVGDGEDGCNYLYNNPLINPGEIQRQSWYDCPCCPSNLTRTWFQLQDTVWSVSDGEIRLNQYISNRSEIHLSQPVEILMESGLPWNGENRIQFHLSKPQTFVFEFRIPSWAGDCAIKINGEPIPVTSHPMPDTHSTAAGFDPWKASWGSVERTWRDGDTVEIYFTLPVKTYHQDIRILGCGGMAAIGRGPLLYCLEQPITDQFMPYPVVVKETISVECKDESSIHTLRARSESDTELVLTPYFTWGNHGQAGMTVFFNLISQDARRSD